MTGRDPLKLKQVAAIHSDKGVVFNNGLTRDLAFRTSGLYKQVTANKV